MLPFEIFVLALKRAKNYVGALGEETIEYPPNEKLDYWATPQNAVVFGWMGVDGVHYAILKVNDHIRAESPVAVFIAGSDVHRLFGDWLWLQPEHP